MGMWMDQRREVRTRHWFWHPPGLWQHLEVLSMQDHAGYAVTIDAAPTTYDVRSQAWVFAICVHTLSLGQLHRVAAITGLPPGKQSKASALLD